MAGTALASHVADITAPDAAQFRIFYWFNTRVYNK
jgi:hypothetical protein